jgi:hypothetical protein
MSIPLPAFSAYGNRGCHFAARSAGAPDTSSFGTGLKKGTAAIRLWRAVRLP